MTRLDQPRGKRGCTYLTKKGEPCPAQAIRSAGYCLAHAPADVRASLGFVAKNPRHAEGRPRVARPHEVMRKMIADGFLLVLESHLDTLGLEAVWTGEAYELVRKPPERLLVRVGIDEETGEDVIEERWVPAGARMTSTQAGYVSMSEYEDLGAKIKVSQDLLDRAFGRAGSSLAITGADGGPLQVEVGPAMNESAARAAAQLAEGLEGDGTDG